MCLKRCQFCLGLNVLIESVFRLFYYVIFSNVERDLTGLTTLTTIDRPWMDNHIPYIYVHIITYPCLKLNAVLAHLCRQMRPQMFENFS